MTQALMLQLRKDGYRAPQAKATQLQHSISSLPPNRHYNSRKTRMRPKVYRAKGINRIPASNPWFEQ